MRYRIRSLAPILGAAALLLPAAAFAGPRSEDDRGFSILLTSPSEAFLTGRRTLRIEAIIPRGDRLEQVDFFLDGKLLATDRKAPYETEADFGPDIRRHTVEVRATTHTGRRARVTLISRSADMAEGAVVKVVALPVVALRGDAGFMDDLGVSDFLVTEDGAPRDLIQFAPGPFPASIAVVLGLNGEAARELQAEAARFAHALPAHDAIALVDGPLSGPQAIADAFSFDPDAVAGRFAAAGAAEPGDLAARIGAAAAALAERRGPRVLLVLLSEDPSAGASLEDPAAAALESALVAGAVVYGVSFGGAGSASEALRDAAERSGGALHRAGESAGFARALQEIAAELRHRYLVAFTPADATRAGWRAVTVRLRGQDGEARAPRSIYIP